MKALKNYLNKIKPAFEEGGLQGSGMSGTYIINADAGQSPHFTSFAVVVQALSTSSVDRKSVV